MFNGNPTLKDLMEDIARRCGLWPNPPADWSQKLFQLQQKGFNSYYKYKINGMEKEDVISLQRASHREGGWWFEGRIVEMGEWLRIYGEWVAW